MPSVPEYDGASSGIAGDERDEVGKEKKRLVVDGRRGSPLGDSAAAGATDGFRARYKRILQGMIRLHHTIHATGIGPKDP